MKSISYFLAVCVGIGFLVLSSAVSAVIPSDIGSLRLWLDASDSATLSIDEGSVLSWADKSSTEAVFSVSGTPTAIGSPTYVSEGMGGLPAVRFSGLQGLISDTRLNFLHNGSGFTAFYVINIDALASGTLYRHVILDTGGWTGNETGVIFMGRQESNGSIRSYYNVRNGTTAFETSASQPVDTNFFGDPSIFQFNYDYNNPTGSGEVLFAGDVLGDASSSTYVPSTGNSTRIPSLGYREGSTTIDNTLRGYISEVLIFEGELTEAQQQQMGYYLTTKYDIETSYVPEPGATAAVIGLLSVALILYHRRSRGRNS